MYRYFVLPLFVLLLAAAPAGPLPVVPAVPAPQGSSVVADRFHFSLSDPGPMCVGRDYPLQATVLVDVTATGSSGFQAQDRVVPGVTIASQMDAPGVATVTPASQTSGALPVDLLSTPAFGNANGLGQVAFTLHAKKAGLANVIVKATLPAALTGGAPQTIQVERPIQVSNCKYKVTLTGSWRAQYPNLVTTLYEQLSGEMSRSEDTGQLSGTAEVSWSLRSYSAMCSHAHSISLSQAALIGSQDNDFLNLKISYASFTLATINCGSSSEGQIPVQTISVSGLPVSGVTVGGLSVSFPVGNEVLNGRGTLTVVPIPIK